jgi:hypothetical protein
LVVRLLIEDDIIGPFCDGKDVFLVLHKPTNENRIWIQIPLGDDSIIPSLIEKVTSLNKLTSTAFGKVVDQFTYDSYVYVVFEYWADPTLFEIISSNEDKVQLGEKANIFEESVSH